MVLLQNFRVFARSILKRVLIDGRWLGRPLRGIGIFNYGFLKSLSELNAAETSFYIVVRGDTNMVRSLEFPENYHFITFPHWCVDPIFDFFIFNYLTLWYKIDKVHFTGNTGFVFSAFGARVILTIHDVSFLKPKNVVPFPSKNFKQAAGRIYRRLLVPLFAKLSDEVYTVSRFASKDIFKELGIPAAYVYHGSNKPNIKQGVFREGEVLEELESSYFVVVSGLDPQKNLQIAVAVFCELSKSLGLRAPNLLVLGVSKGQFIKKYSHIVLSQNIIFKDECTNTEVHQFILRSKTIIVPSYYESFGLPVIEAFACLRMPLCSSSGALSEIAKDKAYYFDPNDKQALYNLVLATWTNELPTKLTPADAEKILRSFSWKNVAEFYLTKYLN